jgi:hypothetical protein
MSFVTTRFESTARVLARTARQADPPRRKSDVFVPVADGDPQAYLLEHEPGNVIDPHFHTVDQFQLFVAGAGRLGRHEVAPFDVHYTDAYSPYGPIVAGAAGVAFLTLRPRRDAGAQYMPGSRGKMVRRAGRNVTHRVFLDPIAVARLGDDAQSVELQAEHPDGFAVWLLRVGASATTSVPNGGGGQYVVVVSGSLETAEAPLAPLSCAFVRSGEGTIEVRAGVTGAELLVLRFPVHRAADA